MTDTSQLRRVRWAIRGVLILGLLASTVANVLHANPNPISQTISAWPVLALYLTIEAIARVPIHRRAVAAARLLVAAVIAGIAAWVSYWHMAGVASRYGETGASPYLLPLSVDGLIVVASICLVELGGRIRDSESTPSTAPSTTEGDSNGEELPGTAGRSAAEDGRAVRPDVEDADPTEARDRQGDGRLQEGLARRKEEVAAAEVAKVATPRKPHPTAKERVEKAHRRTPDATHGQLADRLKLSPRTVRQYRPKPPAETPPINGREPELEGANR